MFIILQIFKIIEIYIFIILTIFYGYKSIHEYNIDIKQNKYMKINIINISIKYFFAAELFAIMPIINIILLIYIIIDKVNDYKQQKIIEYLYNEKIKYINEYYTDFCNIYNKYILIIKNENVDKIDKTAINNQIQYCFEFIIQIQNNKSAYTYLEINKIISNTNKMLDMTLTRLDKIKNDFYKNKIIKENFTNKTIGE